MAKNKPQDKQSIYKDDFIKFLASATPEDINKYITEKGKPAKLIDPMVFFDPKDKDKHEI